MDMTPVFPLSRLWNRMGVQRIGVVVELVPGSRERAEELLAEGPPFDLAAAGFERHQILLGNDRVVFLFEAEEVEHVMRSIVNDPVRAAGLARWAPIVSGAPQVLHEVYVWERGRARGL